MSIKKSSLVTNNDASPLVLNPVSLESGRVRVSHDTIALLTTDIDNTDVILLAKIPTAARILDIRIKNDDLDTGGTPSLTFDVGVYDGETAKDADRYANAKTTLRSATTTWTTVDERTADLASQRLWQDAGDTADPGGVYTIAITIDGAGQTPAAGDLAFQILWTLD